ncbi:hypothetical protein T11_6833 [Trichinella zimbabwensis]|uniref:Uncharacterized protein n=1 Tax=Trichinella zimbabwensis TaxID=268475 RepID=A0A0V1HHL7_9BILA|nr:hypothetical protein T11_6833 [Trichinella zimbabwensis]
MEEWNFCLRIVWLFWQPAIHSFISVGLEEGVAPWEVSLSLFLSRVRKLAIPKRVQAVLFPLAAGRQLQAVLFTTLSIAFSTMGTFSRQISLGNVLVTLSTVYSNSELGQAVKMQFPSELVQWLNPRPLVVANGRTWSSNCRACCPANGSRLLYKATMPRCRDYLVTKAGASTILDNQQTSVCCLLPELSIELGPGWACDWQLLKSVDALTTGAFSSLVFHSSDETD